MLCRDAEVVEKAADAALDVVADGPDVVDGLACGVARVSSEHIQIGEVAARTELSLRTIRHYEETSLVIPSARSQGGFRSTPRPTSAASWSSAA